MNQGPYHLIPLGLILLLGYFISLLGVRLQVLEKQRHRKFWNFLLLGFFLSAAVLGLILAVKVNYKLNVPWTDTVTQWHVDLGISLAFVAAFHLLWHIRYYLKGSGPDRSAGITEAEESFLEPLRGHTNILFVMLGFLTMTAQLALLREFIKSLHGNELVIGLFLSVWMIFTSLGAGAGSKYSRNPSLQTVLRMYLLLAGLPVILYVFMLALNRFLFPPGLVSGIFASASHMLLLLPFTIVSGFLFSLLARNVRPSGSPASYYMLDSMGSLAGGLIFGAVLVFFLNNLQVLILLFFFISLVLAIYFRFPGKAWQRTLILSIALLFSVIIMIPRNYTAMEGMRFRGESVLAVKDTPFGNLAVTERDGMITTYLDMNPLFGSQDLAMDEELVHYPALQRADPESFLIIGGTRAGIGKEVEKYDPAVFHICEPDRWIIRLTGDYINQDKAHILLTADGRNWLAREDCPGYDVVISTAGEPLTLGWNRYFTVEFFRLVHSRLNEGGVFAMQMPSAGNYLNEQGTDQLATVYEGLSAVFSNVLVIPGLATYFLASDQPLSMDFPSLLREHPIATTYVNPDYLDPVRMSFENGLIMETIGNRQGLLNRDLRPVLFFESLTSWNLRTGGRKLVNTGLVALLVLLLLFIAHSGRNMPMFVSGFTGAGSQILLILAAQSFYGFAYLVTPLMITVFMGGLVTGTRVAGRISFLHGARAESLLLGIFSLFAVLTALLLRTGTLVHGSMVGMAFLGLLNIVAGCLVGAVYTTSLKGSRGTAGAVAGNLYGADLAGAALGSFFPPLFLLPLTGVVNTFILFSGFCLVAALSHGLMRTGRGK